jgi:predicted DNA-binding ribbon-helix-helix protein
LAKNVRIRTTTHSVRCEESQWQTARERATDEGVTMNHVLNEFIAAYAAGAINLPIVVKTYV